MRLMGLALRGRAAFESAIDFDRKVNAGELSEVV
jgi:hypothetical protein